jgi:hypothetical protein
MVPLSLKIPFLIAGTILIGIGARAGNRTKRSRPSSTASIGHSLAALMPTATCSGTGYVVDAIMR